MHQFRVIPISEQRGRFAENTALIFIPRGEKLRCGRWGRKVFPPSFRVMKKNVAATRGAIEPIIGVHRDDLINPLCGLKPGYPKNGFHNLIK